MMKNTKFRTIGVSLFCIILLGMLSTSIVANGNYNVALTKGTEVLIVSQYDEAAWKTTVNASTTPSNWFEGDSNQTGAKSKYTMKGWNFVTWNTYDVFVSLFLPLLFESEELITLLGLMNSQGYNETTINTNYTNTYNLWVGLRAAWNFTIGIFEEDPTNTNDALLIFKNPTDFDDILNNYNNLSVELNSLPAFQFSGYSFPILNAEEFLWLFIFNGFTLGFPFAYYLAELITTLDCENATVSDNVLIINRTGETNYTVEISYGSEGIMSSFTVKDEDNNIIYQIVSSNSDWVFYTIIVIIAICIGGLSAYLIFRKLRINKIRNRNK
ncbi:MAG: hypothetical protein JSV23_08890 [Promethearchaeota archaeon]|nr:MAG: hypothetical protein JSV23_08890 [Candidatus Lokiarchaeota archaeon]